MAGCVLELNSSATRHVQAMTDNLIDIALLLTKWSILKNTTTTYNYKIVIRCSLLLRLIGLMRFNTASLYEHK